MKADKAETQEPVRVLESVSSIKPSTNPYLAQLIAALERTEGVEVIFFRFAKAIFSKYDVFHVHWPEVNFGGHRKIGRFVRRLLCSVLMIRLSMTRTPIVRTWHNSERPTGMSRWDRRLLDAYDRRTKLVIRLNDVTEVPLDVPVRTILLGHYRDWFSGLEVSGQMMRRVAYVGLVRRYKGVEDLISAFADVTASGATLLVSGRPSSDELKDTIENLAAGDHRISLSLKYSTDPEFVKMLSTASLVVLPFVHMHNSSTVLAALSLDRPVLVPDNEVNRRLAKEVGEGWIYTYQDRITGSRIDEVLAELESNAHPNPPNLALRDWDDVGRTHLAAFRVVVR